MILEIWNLKFGTRQIISDHSQEEVVVYYIILRNNSLISTIVICLPGVCWTTVGPTESVGRSMEYILWRLAEGLSSELVGDKTGLPWRPPASGDIWPALFTHERFPEK